MALGAEQQTGTEAANEIAARLRVAAAELGGAAVLLELDSDLHGEIAEPTRQELIATMGHLTAQADKIRAALGLETVPAFVPLVIEDLPVNGARTNGNGNGNGRGELHGPGQHGSTAPAKPTDVVGGADTEPEAPLLPPTDQPEVAELLTQEIQPGPRHEAPASNEPALRRLPDDVLKAYNAKILARLGDQNPHEFVILDDLAISVSGHRQEFFPQRAIPGKQGLNIKAIDAALSLLIIKGQPSVSMADIAKEAGVEDRIAIRAALLNWQQRLPIDEKPFMVTGAARATRYKANPSFIFRDERLPLGVTPQRESAQQEELTTPAADLLPEPELEAMDETTEIETTAEGVPIEIPLTEWGLALKADKGGAKELYLNGEKIRMRSICVDVIVVLIAQDNSILFEDLLEVLQANGHDINEDILRGTLHEINHFFEHHADPSHWHDKVIKARGELNRLIAIKGRLPNEGQDFLARPSSAK